jgi:hypothetical protein
MVVHVVEQPLPSIEVEPSFQDVAPATDVIWRYPYSKPLSRFWATIFRPIGKNRHCRINADQDTNPFALIRRSMRATRRFSSALLTTIFGDASAGQSNDTNSLLTYASRPTQLEWRILLKR